MDKVLELLLFLAGRATALSVEIGGLETQNTETWIQEEGFRYCSVTNTSYVQELFSKFRVFVGTSLDHELAQIEVELTQVQGELRPHWHQHSDSVLRCLHSDRKSEAYTEPAGTGFWYPVRQDELFVLPRGRVHGFRQVPPDRPKDFLLLGFSSPGIAEDDVIYR